MDPPDFLIFNSFIHTILIIEYPRHDQYPSMDAGSQLVIDTTHGNDFRSPSTASTMCSGSRRHRTVFTTQQLEILETAFSSRPYPDFIDLDILSESIGFPKKIIQVHGNRVFYVIFSFGCYSHNKSRHPLYYNSLSIRCEFA